MVQNRRKWVRTKKNNSKRYIHNFTVGKKHGEGGNVMNNHGIAVKMNKGKHLIEGHFWKFKN